MAFKVLIALAFIAMVTAQIPQEKECLDLKGYCMEKDDCPHPELPGYEHLCGEKYMCCSNPEPEKCLDGAGECNLHCPDAIAIDNGECPHERERCCVWT